MVLFFVETARGLYSHNRMHCSRGLCVYFDNHEFHCRKALQQRQFVNGNVRSTLERNRYLDLCRNTKEAWQILSAECLSRTPMFLITFSFKVVLKLNNSRCNIHNMLTERHGHSKILFYVFPMVCSRYTERLVTWRSFFISRNLWTYLKLTLFFIGLSSLDYVSAIKCIPVMHGWRIMLAVSIGLIALRI